MTLAFKWISGCVLVMASYCLIVPHDGLSARGEEGEKPDLPVAAPENLSEARSRARLMHELVRGTLQVMHRDFFDDENPHAIPSASLEDVFEEMEKSFDVQMKWMTVDTDLVNVDHRPQTDFQQRAAKQLAGGASFIEDVIEKRYQFAGSIRLSSQCLKCHVKLRTDNKERTAAVLISMPMQQPTRQ